MDLKLKEIKDEFLLQLYEISKLKMVGYIASFIQGEDAFLLRLYLNNEMNPKQLAEELNITKGRVTALINSLKRKNYINISPNNLDKRSIIISLNDNGKNYLEEKLDVSNKYFDNVFTVLGEEDATNLLNTIKRVLIKIKEASL